MYGRGASAESACACRTPAWRGSSTTPHKPSDTIFIQTGWRQMMMTYPSVSVFVAVLAAVRLSTGLSFILLPTSHHVSSSLPNAVRSTTHNALRLRAIGSAPTSTPPGVLFAVNRSARRCLSSSSSPRLCVSEEGLGGEGSSAGEEQSSTAPGDAALLNAVGKVESPEVDLAKGIAFEAPKAKVPAEEEEESQSKKVRVVLYTVLSLLPFLLLLPFLGGRELLPLDPSQM